MKRQCAVPVLALVWLVGFAVVVPAGSVQAASQSSRSVKWLSSVMDQYHRSFDVYTDANAAGNHFSARGRMSSPGGEDALPAMDEASMDKPHSGNTCIKAGFQARGTNWGGWYFMNGMLLGDATAPSENWGFQPNAGIDLRGATRLTFWVKGAKGGERVEFFAFGVGRNAETGTPENPYPDSSPKVTTGYVTLSKSWKKYTLNLVGLDLHYVLGGFGWVSAADRNANQDITFYIDEIQYNKSRLGEPRFLVSYKTGPPSNDFDKVLANVAFTYDNAVALLAYIATGDETRARQIADALVYATDHDRFFDDSRVRNGYQAGDLALPPGWLPNGRPNTVRMPGWYDAGAAQWLEDEFQVSSHTGNAAWAMIALLAFHETYGGDEYLDAARDLGEWVETNFRDTRGQGGYTGGLEGWEKPGQDPLLYKATEHNIDCFAAFERLYLLTGDARWHDRANHAKAFVLSMWDETEGKFWTGTGEDGVTINTAVIPVDIQAWALLALREEGKPYWRALEYAEQHLKVGSGFDFNQDCDGVWFEGTAQMAAAYAMTGQVKQWKAVTKYLKKSLDRSGGMYAASGDGLTTGFDLSDGSPWLYYRRLHVGATAWWILAERKVNPFWLGTKTGVGAF